MDYLLQTIVDFFSGNNELCLGVVTKPGSERFQVQGATKTERVAHRQVLVVHGLSQGDVLSSLASVQSSIQEAMLEIDLELLWDDLLEQGGEPSMADISQAYFGDSDPVHISALGRKMLLDTVHFKRVQNGFAANSREEAAEILALRQARAEKAALRERTGLWVAKVLEYKIGDPYVEVPQEQETFVAQTIDYLLNGVNNEAVNILGRAHEKQSAREVGVRLLKNTGRLPEGSDEFLLVNGIHAGFSKSVLDAADALEEFPADDPRLDLTNLLVFSIDDEETMEIDDALSCQREGDNLIVGIHIADPAFFVQKDDSIDLAAEERPLSMYLPTTTVPMFPARLSHDLASLVAGRVRPSLSFRVVFNGAGELLDWSFASAKVKVAHRLTYDDANQKLSSGTCDVSESLRDLLFVAKKLHEYREECGGVSLNRPEMRVRVSGGKITVEHVDQETPSHQLVGEYMILANHLAAKYALMNDIPVIYRAQEDPSEPVRTLKRYNPCLFDQMVRRMRRTHLSTYPAPHFGLGLDLYTQVSSPLRRYADLVIQRQLSAHFASRPLPYKQEELFSVLDKVDRTSGQNRSLEREANKYWMLEYIARNCIGQEFEAMVVRQEGSLVLAEVLGLYERGVVYTRDSVRVGEILNVTIREALPKAGRLVMDMIDD